MAASESGSYFMASINFDFTIELLLQHRLCKENGHFRRERCKSSPADTCTQLIHTFVFRFVSMENVSMKTKVEYGWVVENIKHLLND